MAYLASRAGGAGSLLSAPDVGWAAPKDAHLLSVGAAQRDLNSPDNGCQSITYRMAGDLSKQMRQGCFLRTAFGWYDEAASVVIFNSTDEAMYVRYGGNPAALSAIPRSIIMGRLGGNPPMGSYYYLYTYLPGALQEQRFYPSLLPYKALVAPPNDVLRDPRGDPLAINGNALAYSSGGQWMVTQASSHGMVRINLATLQQQMFGPSLDTAGQPYASHYAKLAITEDGRYAAVVSLEYKWFKVYDLKTCTAADTSLDMLASANCTSHDYWPWLAGKISGGITGVTGLSFASDSLLNFDIGGTRYALSPDGEITSLIPYLGIGDSYSSGEGAQNYLTGTDTAENRCHLSVRSYPLLLGQDSFSAGGHSVACSGATSKDIGRTDSSYTGQTKDQRPLSSRQADGSALQKLQGFSPGYLAQQDFVTAYRPGVVTVGMGGNDIGFADIILRCVSPLHKIWRPELNEPDCYQSYEDRLELKQTIDNRYADWVAVYKQLQRINPGGRVYAIGYPYIAAASGHCELNVRLSSTELIFTRQAVDYLNQTLARAAAAAGVSFVDISNALDGHQLCGTSSDGMNGVTTGHDELVISHGSYHPTALGQYLMEQAILRATHNFSVAPATASAAAEGPLLQAPTSGRSVNTVLPDSGLGQDSVVAGSSLAVSVDGTGNGLVQGGSYQVRLDGQAIGNGTIGASGSGSSSYVVPITTLPGVHEVSVSGGGQSGGTVIITKIIYVEGSVADSDGDGMPNTSDSCPYVANSGVDSDKDGVDDACDNDLTISGSTGSGGSATAGSGAQDNSSTTNDSQPSPSPTVNPTAPAELVVPTQNPQPAIALGTGQVVTVASGFAPASEVVLRQPVAASPTLSVAVIAKQVAAKQTAGYPMLPRFPWQFWLAVIVGLLVAYQLLGWAADKMR